jgi:hypothetical protein
MATENGITTPSHLTGAEIESVLGDLFQIRAALDAMGPVDMDPSGNEAWTKNYTAVTDAIRVLRHTALATINAELEEDAATVVKAIDDAGHALQGIHDGEKTLQIIGSVLKYVSAIAAVA